MCVSVYPEDNFPTKNLTFEVDVARCFNLSLYRLGFDWFKISRVLSGYFRFTTEIEIRQPLKFAQETS